jgi:hypothetical protein
MPLVGDGGLPRLGPSVSSKIGKARRFSRAASFSNCDGPLAAVSAQHERLATDEAVCLVSKLQLPVAKGDTTNSRPNPTFLLTYVEKPIIINSFHNAVGSLIRGQCLFVDRESLKLLLESNPVAA